ncbi:hypothetical protein SK128_003474 [Halocaridina rubra]|uniref:Uncharacterized protein n=1 Tax=Halocaridina rubra TaxID=373956 RepID=A0AAN9A2V7_HALRR
MDQFPGEIRRLVGIARWPGEGSEIAVKLWFETGFPNLISTGLQQIKDIDSEGMDDLSVKARFLTRGGGKEVLAVTTKRVTAVENWQTLQHQNDLLSDRKEETRGFIG